VNVYIILLGTSGVAYLIMPQISSPILFSILICYVIACYGGSFGTIPSLISDLYGPKRMSTLHGLVLTGWATAGLTAPPIFGYLYDAFPDQAANYAHYICAASLFLSTGLVITFKRLHIHCTAPIPAKPVQARAM
jgi:OFA family oxalate/formate antiporter-like MFS transporter